MHDGALRSGLDALLVAVPFVAVLLVGMFRLDALLAAPRRVSSPRRPPTGTDEHGRMLLSDPDGRPWKDL